MHHFLPLRRGAARSTIKGDAAMVMSHFEPGIFLHDAQQIAPPPLHVCLSLDKLTRSHSGLGLQLHLLVTNPAQFGDGTHQPTLCVD